ncbi:MAG: DUF58 domain-containing protein [Candidatus Eremiobacteraeota bacterium]|nr:DUF58 domain-containing protein [Candidatus Eremiobacteraeota bacterium]
MKRPVPAVWLAPRAIWLVLGIAALLAAASFVPGLLFAVYACTAVFIAAVAADAALGPSATALRVVRRPPPSLALGRAATLEYEVRNRASLAIRVALFEPPVDILTFSNDAIRLRVAARSEATAALAIVPHERGHAHFGPLYAWVENEIGLLRRRYRIDASDNARVFPDLSAVEDGGSLAKRNTLIEAGLRRLRKRGSGSDFESLREYVPGDGFRYVDWKATARRGRLMVAQYDVERSQNVIVALDCGRLMTPRVGGARKLDYALGAALSVARIAQAANDNVGLVAFAAKPILDIAPRRGAAHLSALAAASFDLQPRFEEPDYETVFVALRRRNAKRSLIVLFTDIFDPVTSAAVLAGLGTLVPRHVAMCVLMNDAAIENALDETPATAHAAYRTSVAMTLADERAKSVALLRARGIIVVDVPAPQLTVALLDAYLDVKARGIL